MLLGLLFSAAILGGVIAVMKEGDFPGWGTMIFCVLAAMIPALFINYYLPPGLFIVGLTVGATCAAFAISATCGIGLKRSFIAASIYLAIQAALSALILFLVE